MIFAITGKDDPGTFLPSPHQRQPGTWAIVNDGPAAYANDQRRLTLVRNDGGGNETHIITPDCLADHVIYHPHAWRMRRSTTGRLGRALTIVGGGLAVVAVNPATILGALAIIAIVGLITYLAVRLAR